MQVGGRWGGSADKSDTGENKSQAHIQTLWIRRTSRDLSLKKCGSRGLQQRRTQPVLDGRRGGGVKCWDFLRILFGM